MMRKILGGLALLLLVLIAIIAVNTLRARPAPLADAAPPPPPVAPEMVARLAEALRIPTVSSEAGPPPPQALAAFHAFLERSYPRVHAELAREEIAGGSLLFTWPGRDPAAPALLLAAHQDVVPVEPGTDRLWSHPPFAGTVADGHVWGRGAIDDKGSLIAILEAVEGLLARGVQPRQTVYLAFGHDEEVGGKGAQAMAAALRQRGAKIGLALDEGFAVLDGVLGFVERPVAVVGVAEKGYLSVELLAKGAGGHSSMPGADNAATKIAGAVDRIAANQMPARIEGLPAALLDAVAPYSGWPMRAAFTNRWLTAPLIERQFLAGPDTAAVLRTTTAPTLIRAGTKDNVLPQAARAVINHRILPGDSIAGVLAHDRALAGPDVTVRPLPGGHEPSRPADIAGADYRRLAATIRASYPHAPIAPGLVLGATDGRHYETLARSTLRFSPIVMDRTDLSRFHGNDERLSIANYARAIDFYARLIASR